MRLTAGSGAPLPATGVGSPWLASAWLLSAGLLAVGGGVWMWRK